ncbi:MAG: membrane protein insertion efficiency factor YidD [Candidatus Gracilibacteria bacterium]
MSMLLYLIILGILPTLNRALIFACSKHSSRLHWNCRVNLCSGGFVSIKRRSLRIMASQNLFPHGYRKFSPSCSEYGYQSIQKYGIFRGVPKTIWRILRCNPWSKGGDDPVQ